MSAAPAARLYQDAEIKAIAERFKCTDNLVGIGPADHLLSIVSAGGTKKLKQIFERLNLDPKRLEQPRIEGVNMVKFYVWRVSPGFELSIMVATNDRGNDFSDIWGLNGYGVRIYEAKQER